MVQVHHRHSAIEVLVVQGGASINTVSGSNTVYKIDVTLFISTKYTKM